MVSLSTGVARRRAFYLRPIPSMPDILMVDIPEEFGGPALPPGNHHPILVETIAEQHELDACLEGEGEVSAWLDQFAARPSTFSADHIMVAHYGPPDEGWPYVLLCRWPPDLVAAASAELRMFIRGAYTIETFAGREQLERASETALALLKRRRMARVEIIAPAWSAAPGKRSH